MSDLLKFPFVPISRDKIDPEMPQDGDAVLVLRGDGTTGMFLLGIETKKLLAKAASGADLSEEDQRQLDVANRVLALYLAAINPQIMEMLITMATDPSVLTPEILGSLPSIN